MTTHRMTGTKEYQAWSNMKRRCEDPSNIRFHRYGARGISVCERWNKFENFFADMGPCNGMTIERVNSDSNYEPSNCKWIPFSEQGKNTCRIRYLTFNGETHSLAEWARKIGVRANTLTMRLNAYGWTVEKALSKGGVL